MDEWTIDNFCNGDIRIKQKKSGYRFSVDAVLLAHHARPRPEDRVLDMGTGSGIIALILAHRSRHLEIVGIEVQPELAELARENVSANGMEDRIQIRCQDLNSMRPRDVGGLVDMVICNPPYRKTTSGRINPDRQRAVAKHEIMTTLKAVVSAAERLLTRAGCFLAVYPAERAVDILTEMRSAGIEPKTMRVIYPHVNADSKRILIEGVKGGRPGLRIASPLVIYQEPEYDEYTDEVAAMFRD